MIIKAIVAIENFRDQTIQAFRDDETGLALTEYLVLLGLLVGAVIATVTLFGAGLNIQWGNWNTWIRALVNPNTPAPV